MADKKFSQFTVATTATDASLAGLQDGENVLIPSALLNDLINAIPLTGTEVGNPVTGPIEFGVGGQNIARGTFDNGTGGDNGVSLNCAVGYELNWQGGKLSVKTGSTIVPYDCRPYKVYTALLTQSGGSVGNQIGTGQLTLGVTYYIFDSSLGMDFTNVGAPDNNVGTYFVATGTTPNSWGDSEGNDILTYNSGAPVATVLENNIGNIYWVYGGVGQYIAFFDSVNYLVTYVSISQSNSTAHLIATNVDDNSALAAINSQLFDGTSVDSRMYYTPIEIRVYN